MAKFNRFHVLYSDVPGPSQRYRQIVAMRSNDGTFYEVRIFEGKVVQMDPDFSAEGSGAEYYMHETMEAADADADAERDRSLEAGWLLYSPPAR
jgi:hypothetical protein